MKTIFDIRRKADKKVQEPLLYDDRQGQEGGKA